MQPTDADARQPAEPKVALVTGGAVRVGRAIALALARAGHDVAFSYHRSATAAGDLVREIETLGQRARALAIDLRDPSAADELVTWTRSSLGPLDVLVCSAASFATDSLDTVDAEAFDDRMALNARAPLLLARAAAPDLRRHGRGRIVHIADLSAERPFPGRLVHAMTKAALLALTRGLALELGPDVQVHAVVPGTVLPPESWSAAEVEAVVAPTPTGRSGRPEDVGEAVAWLATCSPFLTGTVLHVDGGAHVLGPPG